MLKALVIDDERLILDMVEGVLRRFGFSVETASDGKEGINKFDNNNFDLVITDICMPKIDGNGVARHIRISGKQNIPIIGISGTPWLAQSDDFDTILLKPFSIKALVDSAISMTASLPHAFAN
ncbi:MAG: response regulator [Actinomycetia bacterium]|nr:response regulator [Actinomycetes bacterium]